MKINSAVLSKRIVKPGEEITDGIPQVAFIGRSNVGKSSVINSLTRQKNLARTSSKPGYTQIINLFLINEAIYLVDLPGYGYARASFTDRQRLEKLIDWYFFESKNNIRKVVLIIDALVGPTDFDLKMLQAFKDYNKNVVIVANKIDKIKKSILKTELNNLSKKFEGYKIIPYSSLEKIGISELIDEILG